MTIQGAAPRSRIWTDWDVPLDQLVRGFTAAASFYRAMPWQSVTELTEIRATLPGGSRWALYIEGPMKDSGILAYREYEDGRTPRADAILGDEDPCIALGFGTNEKMPEEVLREIREMGGDLAGPAAYPRFYDFAGIACCFTLEELDEVITLVEAVPRYVKARKRLLTAEGVLARRRNVLTQVSWTDDSSGVQFEDGTSGD